MIFNKNVPAGGSVLDLETKVREVFAVPDPTKAFALLKAPTSTLTIKTIRYTGA